MESNGNIIENKKNILCQKIDYDILYDSFDDYTNNNSNKSNNNFDTITFHYKFNNEKLKYTTKIKKGDSKTLKEYINKIYNKRIY